MKRRILLIISICLLMIFTQVGFSFADVQKNEINNLSQFKEKINALYKENPFLTPDSIEIKNLINETSPNVIEDFLDEKLGIIKSEMIKEPISQNKKVIDLGDNCYLKINKKNNESTITPFASTPGGQTLWKDYGSRKFTSTFEGFLVVASFDLNICNHYTLSSRGISPRYVEAWGDGSGIINISVGSIKEPKRYASIGETVSANCVFSLHASVSLLQYQRSFKMYNYVKCSDIDTVEKQVKVVQSWRGEWLR